MCGNTMACLLKTLMHHLWLIHMLHILDQFHMHPQDLVIALMILTSIIPGMVYLDTMRYLIPILFLQVASNTIVGAIIPLPSPNMVAISMVLIQLLSHQQHGDLLTVILMALQGPECFHLRLSLLMGKVSKLRFLFLGRGVLSSEKDEHLCYLFIFEWGIWISVEIPFKSPHFADSGI